MRCPPAVHLGIQGVLAVVVLGMLGSGVIPAGVPREWVWARPLTAPAVPDLLLATLAAAAYALFVAAGGKFLSRPAGFVREAAWVVALVVCGAAVQVALMAGAPAGYGLTKWATLAMTGSSGYYTIARRELNDPRRFWAEYEHWIARQDALHIGTHPPGLLLLSRAAFDVAEANPGAARWIDDRLPATVVAGFRQLVPRSFQRTDRAAIALLGMMALVGSAATAGPLYALARSAMPAGDAWKAAALWPLVPAAVLFQPAADAWYPFLSTLALALAARGSRGHPAWAAAAGAVMAIGMVFTLAFLPVGLVAAILYLADGRARIRQAVVALAATGAGFLGVTLATWAVSGSNPFAVWWWNQKNHARFYQEFPRSYLAWVLANPVELAVALGLPVACWAFSGFARRKAPVVAWATLAVLVFLNLSGKNLSEVARLWLPLMPPLCVAAGAGMADAKAGPRALGATILLMALVTLALQAIFQVVYPA